MKGNFVVPPESDGGFYRSLNERFFAAFRMIKVFFRDKLKARLQLITTSFVHNYVLFLILLNVSSLMPINEATYFKGTRLIRYG